MNINDYKDGTGNVLVSEQLISDLIAIVESGSNANGRYIKFSDGTMICTHQILNGGIVPSLTSIDIPWTFPALFYDSNYGLSGFFNCIENGVGYRNGIVVSPTTDTLTNSSVAITGRDILGGAFNAYRLQLLAIGRWK